MKQDNNLVFTLKMEICKNIQNYITHLWKNPIYIIGNNENLQLMWTWPHRPLFDIEKETLYNNHTMKHFSHILYHTIQNNNYQSIEDIEQNCQNIIMPHLHNVNLQKVMTQTLQFCLDSKGRDALSLMT